MEATRLARRLPDRAEVLPGGGAHFRVWASCRRRVELVFEGVQARPPFELEPEDGGNFSEHVDVASAGALYRFSLYSGDRLYHDPA